MRQIGFLWNGVDNMRRGRKFLFGLLGVMIALSMFVWYEHRYEMQETSKWIPLSKGKLSAVVVEPVKRRSKGIGVLVHGDAPVDATNEGGYRPMMEQFAKAGFTTISWAKLGVAGSYGNWLHQSMDDRAAEVTEVIQWAMNQPELNTEKIILWGVSQGGWVVPKVAAQKKVPISKVILVSPAINWLRQNDYYTTQKLKREGQTQGQIQQALEQEEQIISLMKKNVSYQEYLANTPEQEPMSQDRWIFAKKNLYSDVQSDLEKIEVPVDLFLADHDENVDVIDTEKIYSKKIPKELLTIFKIKDAAHSMVDSTIAQSEVLTVGTYLLAPKDFLMNKSFLRQSYLSVE
ncbi:alpha/beta hydrolase family protein [Enterococcus silesiacus]|nr:alpha/beta hydrolase [Enterococcus silesiacus]